MLITVLLVLGIGFLQNIMFLFSDVMNLFNEPSCFVSLHVSMRRVNRCGCKGKRYINGAQWLKPKSNLKRVVASRAMKSLVVIVLYIRNEVIPHVWIFGVVYTKDVHDNHIDHLYLAINFGMEGIGFD